MGKTKTAFISETDEGAAKEKKSSKQLYEEKRLKQSAEGKKSSQEDKKKDQVGKMGMKGGERIATVDAGPIITDEELTPSEETKKAKGPKIRGKKYKKAESLVDKEKAYQLADAIKLVKETSISKFDGTVEMHLVVKKVGTSTQIELPHSTGKVKRVEIADEKTIQKLKSGKVDFDVLLSTAEMMPNLVPFAKVLGPKGMMPNPKNGTLIKDKKEAKKFGGNSITLKTEKKVPVIHASVGKVSQKQTELKDNVTAVIEGVGSKQIIKAVLTSTMGPGIKLQVGK